MTIRPIEPERDATPVVALLRELSPTILVDVPTYLHRYRTTPERADRRTWAAVVDGEIAGHLLVMRNFFTTGSNKGVLEVLVREAYRRRGIGSELYEHGLAYARELGVDGLISKFHDSDAGTAFATSRGFELMRAETKSILEPALVTERPPAELDLRAVADVDPQLIYQVDVEASLDMPQIEQMNAVPYEEWVEHVLDYPQFSAEGSFCAMVDGVAAATSFLCVEPETGRGLNMFTGTLRAYRGRGLARAVKLASTHWAAEHGVKQIVTTNDETNAAMLAVNRSLGYRPAGREVDWLKELK